MMMIAPHAKYPAYCISSLHLAHLQVLHRIMGTCIMNTTERDRGHPSACLARRRLCIGTSVMFTYHQ